MDDRFHRCKKSLIGVTAFTLILSSKPFGWHCQTNLIRPAKGADPRRSGRQLPPLGQGGGTVLSEDIAAVQVTVLVEMVVDRGMGGGRLLQGLDVPEPGHRDLEGQGGDDEEIDGGRAREVVSKERHLL